MQSFPSLLFTLVVAAALTASLAAIGAHASLPSPSPLVFKSAGTGNSPNGQVGVRTAAGEGFSIYYSSKGNFHLYNGTGTSWTVKDPTCNNDNLNCAPLAFVQTQPGVACWIAGDTCGCLDVAEKTIKWSKRTPQTVQAATASAFLSSASVMFLNYYISASARTGLAWIDLNNGTTTFTFTMELENPTIGCDGASGMCVTANQGNSFTACGFSWRDKNSTCLWSNNSITFGEPNYGPQAVAFSPASGGRTLALISNSAAIEAFDVATGAYVYQVGFDGGPYTPNPNDQAATSNPVVCGDYVVAVFFRVSVWRADDPAATRVSSNMNQNQQIMQLLDVQCNGTHLAATMTSVSPLTPAVYGFETPSMARAKLTGSFTVETDDQSTCGTSGMVSLICGATSVYGVDIFGPVLHPFLATAGITYGGIMTAILPKGTSIITYINNNDYSILGANVAYQPRGFGRNESFVSFAYLPLENKLLTTTAFDDGLSVVSVPDMELQYDTAVVAGDSSANTGNSGSGSAAVASPTFAGQAGLPPFKVIGAGDQKLAVAPGLYANYQLSVTCFNAFALDTGRKKWQACTGGTAAVAGHTSSLIFAADTAEDDMDDQISHAYAFKTTDGTAAFAKVSLQGDTPVGIVADDLATTVYVGTYDDDESVAIVRAISVATGAVLWKRTVSQEAGALFPPQLENGVLYACTSLSGSVTCLQLRADSGTVAQTITVSDATSNIFFSGGRCFIARQRPNAGVAELYWGATTAPHNVITVPDVALQEHQITSLGSAGSLIALQITDTQGSGTWVSLYNVRRGEHVWTVKTVLPGGQGISVATADAAAGYIYAVAGSTFAVMSFYTGAVISVFPYAGGSQYSASMPLIATAGGLANGTVLVGLDGRIGGMPSLVRPLSPASNIETLSPVPAPTAAAPTTTGTPSTLPATTSTTGAAHTTTAWTWPPNWTPTPPPTSPGGGPHTPPPTPSPTPNTPSPWSPGAAPDAADEGPNPAALGVGITAGVLVFTGCLFFFIRRQVTKSVNDTHHRVAAINEGMMNSMGGVGGGTTVLVVESPVHRRDDGHGYDESSDDGHGYQGAADGPSGYPGASGGDGGGGGGGYPGADDDYQGGGGLAALGPNGPSSPAAAPPPSQSGGGGASGASALGLK